MHTIHSIYQHPNVAELAHERGSASLSWQARARSAPSIYSERQRVQRIRQKPYAADEIPYGPESAHA